jgi:hypothetical protein
MLPAATPKPSTATSWCCELPAWWLRHALCSSDNFSPRTVLEGVVCKAEYTGYRLNCPHFRPASWPEQELDGDQQR